MKRDPIGWLVKHDPSGGFLTGVAVVAVAVPLGIAIGVACFWMWRLLIGGAFS